MPIKPPNKQKPSPPAKKPVFQPQPSKIPEEDFEERLGAAIEAQDYPGALQILDEAPRGIRKQPGFTLIRASVLLSMGDDYEALQILRDLERKNPQFTLLYSPLAMSYMNNEWAAHAMQAAKRALASRELDSDGRAELEQIFQESNLNIQTLANKFGQPFENMRRACLANEQAQIAMRDDKLAEAEHYAREAIKLVPLWNPPHNNRAWALYFSGRIEEAIAISEEVLQRDAGNTFALYNLVTFCYGLEQLEKARDYSSRLKKLFTQMPPDDFDLDHAIWAFALIEDTPFLWDIAKQYLKEPGDSLFARSWYCLAVAAVRSDKWKEALRLIKKANSEELTPMGQKFQEAVEKIANQRYPRLAWMPPVYPTADLFFIPKIMGEWDAMSENFSEKLSPSQYQKQNNFFQKYPFIVVALKNLLWEEESHSFAVQILAQFETPEADAEILRFAMSQTGSQETRVQALLSLNQHGRYQGPKTVEIWNENREEWRLVELNLQRIGSIQANAQPQTMALIEKAHRIKNPQEAINLLRKAVALEPTSPIAVFNLGVMLVQNGQNQEGETLIYHAVEVDPNYTFGHASIALTEAEKGHEKEALDHLEIVTRAKEIARDTAALANLA